MATTRRCAVLLAAILGLAPGTSSAQGVVKIGFNYPRTGPYFAEGLDQLRAATMATDEINTQGGILGRKVELVVRDDKARVDVTKTNVNELIDREGVKMIFGGAASSTAVATGDICEQKKVLYFGTLTYSNDTTGKGGHRHTFRECYNAWMGAKVLGRYMRSQFAGKRYFYITSDYTWGWTTEDSFRRFTGTTDRSVHRGTRTPFPESTAADFKRALKMAQDERPDVLVLVLFGQDMVDAINIAAFWGMKEKMQFVVPNVTLAMAEGAGARNMAGVLGAMPWSWRVPSKYGTQRGIRFVEDFEKRYGRYPSTSGASAYTILYEYKAAVERAGTFDDAAVIKALEGHPYTLLKDRQIWRDFDHQSVQTVYAVRCKAPEVVVKDKHQLDYYEIIDEMSGEEAVQTKAEWEAERAADGKPPYLEKLPGEK